jgi:hypothetical protein
MLIVIAVLTAIAIVTGSVALCSKPGQSTSRGDLYESARLELWVKAADNPRLAALLSEIDRGRRERGHGE